MNKSIIKDKNIETPRLLLRKSSVEDTPLFIKLYKNHKVREFLGGIIENDIIEAKIDEIHEHWNKNKFGFNVVCLKPNLLPIGLCGLELPL